MRPDIQPPADMPIIVIMMTAPTRPPVSQPGRRPARPVNAASVARGRRGEARGSGTTNSEEAGGHGAEGEEARGRAEAGNGGHRGDGEEEPDGEGDQPKWLILCQM